MDLRGKKVLVTGAGGFIGSHLVEALQDAGCSVRALVFYDINGSWGFLDALPRERTADLEVVAGDVRDAGFVRSAAAGIDVIFHLAALVSIPYSYVAPESYVDTNVKGTLNVLLAARDLEIERTLITSTSEVYGSARYVPDRRESSASRSVALFGLQDRRRQFDRVVRSVVLFAGDYRTAIQHLRSTSVATRSDPGYRYATPFRERKN